MLGGLPFNVLVGEDIGISTDAGVVFVVEIVGIVEGYCGHILEGRDVAVTILSPAGTQLQEVHPATCRLHEVLVADDPTCRYGGEVTPSLATLEVRRAVGAQHQREQVCLSVVVVHTSEERGESSLKTPLF